MSKLYELIKELCPEGVAYKSIGEIFDRKRGYTPSKSNKEYWENGTIPWFIMEDIRENGRILSDAIQKVNIKGVKRGKLFKPDSIIVSISATVGEHALITIPFLTNERFTVLRLNKKYDKKYNIMFIYYCCFALDEWCKKNTTMSSFASVDMICFKNFQIPLPPLAVQEEIVRILDNFTELITKLTTELTARKKQYEYYRNQLLDFDKLRIENGEWRTLGEIGKFTRGGRLQKKDFTETGVGCIHYGQIYTYYGTYTDKTKTFISEEFAKKAKKAKYGDLVIATTSANNEDVCKAVAWLGPEEIAVSRDACFYTHNMHPKYVAYFFQTEQFKKQKRPLITGTKVKRVNVDNLAKIKLPVPTLAEQQRIVDILDRFNTLCNDISNGLPAEIKMRQQQYEYYRDKLLTFKKLKMDNDDNFQRSIK
ncbi:restriction endonuclease [Candidatus Epulonipiscioides gigas]|nr:restriction endonuclease [Epulopiscium sp. SCG-C07WGA-EpuloA2]